MFINNHPSVLDQVEQLMIISKGEVIKSTYVGEGTTHLNIVPETTEGWVVIKNNTLVFFNDITNPGLNQTIIVLD